MNEHYCVFPGAIGLNRILKTQSFSKQPADGDADLYSWPVPQKDGKSCSVVILGEPGTGKTRLALEMAARLKISIKGEKEPKPCTVIYYSLEQSPQDLREQAKALGANVGCVVGPQANTLPQASALRGRCKNIIFFPVLSPRRLEQTGRELDNDSVFWRRYEEIKLLLEEFAGGFPMARAAFKRQQQEAEEEGRKLEQPALLKYPPPMMVVIDSLNVFGDKPVSRYMIEQLFALFHEHGLVGVCVAEDPESAPSRGPEEPLISPGISNIADVVIKLGWKTEYDYQYRRIEVMKSRHTPNAYGSHCMKIVDTGIHIFPSLHCCYTFLTRNKDRQHRSTAVDLRRLDFGGNWLSQVRNPVQAVSVPGMLPSIVHTIAGPMESGKTKLALSYGLAAKSPDKFLLVSFDVSGQLQERAASLDDFQLAGGDDLSRKIGLGDTKGTFDSVKNGNQVEVGYQLWFAPGFLLAEEMVHFISEALAYCRDVTRVVILDIGQIPTRHPALAAQMEKHSEPFVVLVELFRQVGVDACFVCTDKQADAAAAASLRLMDSLAVMLRRISHGTIACRISDQKHNLYEYSGKFANSSAGEQRWSLEGGTITFGPFEKEGAATANAKTSAGSPQGTDAGSTVP